ncbi:MAG: general secretion pathway protein GspE, partial [Nitrospirae bacterium]|nr:general secretion pathway protein GspE [Nitrospirota bacterium]
MKFGTLLAREKVITPEQLEDALKNQVVYGGRLGTILLTLGHIDIET